MGVWKESHNDFQADHGSVACRYVHGQMSAAKLCVQKYTNQILGQQADLLQSRHLWLSPKMQYRHREVSSRCNDWAPELTRDYLSKEICSKIDNLTPTGVKVPLYLTGKADCA